ncbi:MAG: cytochrome c [Trueperaceae bacterium]|nr:cytochrome c [Trueperaceae bacterium]
MRIVIWLVRLILAVVVIVVVALGVVYALSARRINKTYDVQPASLSISTDETSVARGQHIATVRGCMDCHGAGAGGAIFMDAAPVFARISASNLTSGKGGIGSSYSDADWVRSIRHGIGPDQKSLLFMPSAEFAIMSEQDLADLIAYLKSLPAKDSDLPPNSVGPIARILTLAGQFPLLPAEEVDHKAAIPGGTPTGVSLEHGEYLAITCTGCHGTGLSGGPIPGSFASDPVPANLTPDPATGLGNWSETDFYKAMREGQTPEGKTLDPFMPWQSITSKMTDEELSSLWLYLQSLPAQPKGGR